MQTSQVHTSKVSTYIDIELFMLVSILSYSVFVVYSVLTNNNLNTQLWFKILPSQSVNPMPFTMSLKREREDLAINNMHDSFRGLVFDFQHPQSGCS